MGITVRQFVESLSTNGIVSAGDLTAIREAMPEEKQEVDAEPLVRDLVKQGKLTKFQAMNLYQGRGRGLVFGEYVILDKIGAGGMGQVYKAQHKRMKRIVALKVLPPQAVKSQKSIQRFYQEVEVAAKLHHPNIVTAYDAGEAHGMHFLVMEYVDGKDLSSHIHKNGPLSLEQTLNVALQTARGLAYAHELNIVHRDIKPSNLLVDRKGVVKILDMGLARSGNPIDDGAPGQELTADGEVMGTMDYMAPEQAVDTRNADQRADIYSLGCTIYRLYVNKAPYEGETAVQKILAHRDKPIPSLQAARPETPDMVDRLYQKMLAKNPAERVQTMKSVVTQIERMLSGVDDDRSSVMLGAETVDDDLGFVAGSGVGIGSASGLGLGSSLGGSSAGGSQPGSSGIHVTTSPQKGAATVVAPAVQTARATATVGSSSRDTDAIVRSIMQAKPAPPKEPPSTKKPSRMPLYVVGGLVAAAIVGAAVFFLTRPKPEPPADQAIVAVNVPARDGAGSAGAAPVPVAVPTATAVGGATSQPPVDFFTSPKPAADPPQSPAVEPTPVTDDVELLSRIDPEANGRGGRWFRDGDAVACDTSGSGVHLLVPFTPAGDFDLHGEAVVPVNGQFGFSVPMENATPLVVVGQPGVGVHTVDDRNWNDASNPTYRRGSFFSPGTPVQFTAAVRGKRLFVRLDRRAVIDYTDDEGRIKASPNYQQADGRLFLNAGQGTHFTKLVVTPPRITPSSESPPLESEVDLLALVDPARHGQHGRWLREGTALLCESHSGPWPRVVVPFQPPAEYDLTCVAVTTQDNRSFGPGLVVDDRNVTFLANDDKLGLGNIDGRRWSDVGNVTYRQNPAMYFRTGDEVTIVCSVRAGRVYVTLNDRPVVDFRGETSRLSHVGELSLPPRQMHLYGEGGVRFTKLTIGPPARSLKTSAGSVNVAAAFDSSRFIEGTAAANRGGVQFAAEANKMARVDLGTGPPGDYAVTLVVERDGGLLDSLALTLPFAGRRTSVLFDHRLERFLGVQYINPGGVDINPTGRRYGYQLTPGELHVLRAVVTKDPQGWRVRASLNGREVINYAGADYNEDGNLTVPDRQALSLATWSSGWRVWRIDVGPVDGRGAPVPDTPARSAAVESLAALIAPADARTASHDQKLLAVDLLRQGAARESDDAALRYAALDEALRIAVGAGDLIGAHGAAEDLCAAFDVEPAEVRARVVEAIKAFRSTQADAKKQFNDDVFQLMDAAAKAEQWDYALELNGALDKSVGTTNSEMKRELKIRAGEYAFAKSLAEESAAARAKFAAGEKLEPTEQTTLGKYHCFVLGDWPVGLQALTQSDDAGLRAAATIEPDPAKPADGLSGDAKFAVAEKWWELSEKEKSNPLKWAAAERAALWYQRSAASSMADKSRALLPKRITSLGQLRRASGGAGGPRRPIDAVKLGTRWYKAFPVATQWDVAVQTCEQWGGNLVVIDSPQENDAVARVMLQSLTGQAAERCAMWIGISDTEQEGVFRRLDGVQVPTPPPQGAPAGTTVPGFSDWAYGEPNNGGGDEDFGYMDVSLQNGQIYTDWRDGPRNGYTCYFVCEWDH